MGKRLKRVKNTYKIIKEVIIIVVTILTLYNGLDALDTWKESIRNPVRNEIITIQTKELINILEYIDSIKRESVLTSSYSKNFIYYYSHIDKNFMKPETSIDYWYLYKFKESENYTITNFTDYQVNKDLNIAYDKIFVAKNTDELISNIWEISQNQFLSQSIRDNANEIFGLVFELIYSDYINTIDNALNNYNINKTQKLRDIDSESLRKLKPKIDIILMKLEELYDEIYKILNINELYNISY